MIWEFKHCVIADAALSSVWRWHSNVDNWVRFEGGAVESITLDGPFQSGTHITTKMPGQEVRRSTLMVVEPPRHTLIEMDLGDAVLRFNWAFEELPDGRTSLTQHITLDGPGASAYVQFMEQNFVPNIGPGMERIAAHIKASQP